MDASARLRAGRDATHAGRFEEALSHFVWFHDHALEEDSAFTGVRLSFALGYWLELAERYPPAMAAFRAKRDAARAKLSAGEDSRDLFHDVEAMSEQLGEDEVAADLFATLHRERPTFAAMCSSIAFPLLVRTKRFDIAAAYMANPTGRVRALVSELMRDVEEIDARPRSKAPRFRAFVQIFAEDLQNIEAVLHASGAAQEATALRQQALATLKPKYLQNAVSKLLASDA